MRVLPVIRALALLPLVILASAGPGPVSARPAPARENQQPIIIEPLDLGLQEEAGVALLSLDVEVLDEQGRPMPGLTMDDFKIVLDGKRWPLVAVDDFCTGTEAPVIAGTSGTTGTGRVSGTADAGAAAGAAPVPVQEGEAGATGMAAGEDPGGQEQRRYVLFIDFSQLRLAGRDMAEVHARRWLNKAKQPGDLAMLAGYSTEAGLKTLTVFTREKEVLLRELEAAFAAEDFMDPFPEAIPRRQMECDECLKACIRDGFVMCERGCCYRQAREDFLQGRRSLDAMDLLLTTLEGLPGHKDLILFNQNGLVYPAQLYPVLNNLESFDVGDHQDLIKTVAASATASRTSVHTANLPMRGNLATTASEGARDLGTRLADYTGGTTNRAIADLDGILVDAGRGSCRYRLSISSPDNPPNRAMRVRVMVRGRRLPGDYRIRFYSVEQRWFRQAQAALAAPGQTLDPPMIIALSPSYLRDELWVVKVQVAFALSDLELVPTVTQRIGRWRVGALLHTEDGEKDWEMLSMARATLEGLGSTRLEAVHERRIGSLKPGAYRLRLFVEDAQRNIFSAREVSLDLPAQESLSRAEPWLHGPDISRRIDSRLSLGLPFTSSEPPIPTPVGPPAVGQIPVVEAAVPAGTVLEFTSMLCPRPDELKDPSTTSLVLLNDLPIARLPAPELSRRGRCVHITDEVDTSALPPGRYSYRLIIQLGETEPLESEVSFQVDS